MDVPILLYFHFDIERRNWLENSVFFVVKMLLTAGNLVKDGEGFVLIQQQLGYANGYFSENVMFTGLENEHDPFANTYCIIGGLNPSDYLQSDRVYDLKLIYRYKDGTKDVLKWTQKSWLTDYHVVGADLSKIVDAQSDSAAKKFRGLARSNSPATYLDGNGGAHSNRWHSVASTEAWREGIPAHEGACAVISSLWIRPAEGIACFP